MRKIGVERRVYTAGRVKDRLDPFRPERDEDIRRLRAIQDIIHGQFIDWVKSRRGDRLRGAESALFSGDFWDQERGGGVGSGGCRRRRAGGLLAKIRR